MSRWEQYPPPTNPPPLSSSAPHHYPPPSVPPPPRMDEAYAPNLERVASSVYMPPDTSFSQYAPPPTFPLHYAAAAPPSYASATLYQIPPSASAFNHSQHDVSTPYNRVPTDSPPNYPDYPPPSFYPPPSSHPPQHWSSPQETCTFPPPPSHPPVHPFNLYPPPPPSHPPSAIQDCGNGFSADSRRAPPPPLDRECAAAAKRRILECRSGPERSLTCRQAPSCVTRVCRDQVAIANVVASICQPQLWPRPLVRNCNIHAHLSSVILSQAFLDFARAAAGAIFNHT
jgi:hypothetical protein